MVPFWSVLVISLNEGMDTAQKGVSLWPRIFTLDSYRAVMKDSRFFQAFLVSIGRVVAGTGLSILFTSMYAYGLSKDALLGRRAYMRIAVITMFFGGGLIPTFLLVRDMGLFDTFSSLVIPGLISVYHMIVFRTFFRGIPEDMEESARMDGCSYMGIFFRIVVPVSKPVFAALSLFTAVALWNEWFYAGIYINNPRLLPLQNYLFAIMNLSSYAESIAQLAGSFPDMKQPRVTTRSIQAAAIIISILPVMLVYPFVQKYFIQGMLTAPLKDSGQARGYRGKEL